MNIRTLILDDDENSRLAACTALADYEEIEIVGCFSHSEELVDFLQSQTAHVLFLDIELDGELGFSIAHRLMQKNSDLMIVFLTGHSSYAIDGYDFHPVDFLTKPINPVKLEKTVTEIRKRMEQKRGQRSAKLMFRLQQGYRIIDVRDLCYIERKERKNYLHTADEVLCIAGYTIRELEDMLTEHGFFLCHQSFLISVYRVIRIRDAGRQLYEVLLRDCPKPVPVSRHRYEKMQKCLREIGIDTI